MTFYIAGQDAPNPTLQARPGERIRIVLSNTDVGMSHDFAIRSWRVNTKLLKGKGQASIEFTVPTTPRDARVQLHAARRDDGRNDRRQLDRDRAHARSPRLGVRLT